MLGIVLSITLEQAIPEGTYLTYAGRNASAAPAVGYMSVHVKEQQALVTQDALD